MPRTVDHDLRRAELVAALWRVVRRSGIQAVSVRTVAAEAGTSPSALRYYFASNDELLGFALTAAVTRVEERLRATLPGMSDTEGAVAILEQFLPLDEERRLATEVYLAFIGRAQSDPGLRRIRDTADGLAREAVRHALGMLQAGGGLAGGHDLDEETDRVYALLDGLAMHGALMPGRYPPEHQRRVLAMHLDGLRRTS